jgi:ABC-type branched-subunit amino acid transport system substrate-binding protein
MLRTFRSRPVARAVVALAGASLFVTACGAGGGGDGDGDDNVAQAEGDTTGITDDSIRLGTHMPLTGPVAPGYSEIPTGSAAYYDYVNANGGVCDRQIDYTVRDDAYNPTQTSGVVNQLVLQDEVFAVVQGLGTPTHSAVVDFLNEEGVPDLFVSSGSVEWGEGVEEHPNTFGWQPNYAVEGKIIGQYIAENFPDAKVGLFLQGDDFGRDGGAGVRRFVEDQIVSEVTYTPGNLDVGPQIAQLKADGADFVIGFSTPTWTALSQLTAQRLNYDPEWFYSNVGSDTALVGSRLDALSEGAVSGESALADIYTSKYIPLVESTEDPWIQLFSGVWDEHGAGGEFTNFRNYGMSQAYTVVKALGESCDNLSREGVVQTIEEKGSDWEGPWSAPLEYSAESHRGISGVSVGQIQADNSYEALTPVLLTDSEDGEITEYTEEPSPPENEGLPS